MTKEQLIKFMEEWPDDTIVRISAWPFIAEIQAIQCSPENGRASIIVDKGTWFMNELE